MRPSPGSCSCSHSARPPALRAALLDHVGQRAERLQRPWLARVTPLATQFLMMNFIPAPPSFFTGTSRKFLCVLPSSSLTLACCCLATSQSVTSRFMPSPLHLLGCICRGALHGTQAVTGTVATWGAVVCVQVLSPAGLWPWLRVVGVLASKPVQLLLAKRSHGTPSGLPRPLAFLLQLPVYCARPLSTPCLFFAVAPSVLSRLGPAYIVIRSAHFYRCASLHCTQQCSFAAASLLAPASAHCIAQPRGPLVLRLPAHAAHHRWQERGGGAGGVGQAARVGRGASSPGASLAFS